MKVNIKGEVIRAIDEKSYDRKRRVITLNFEVDGEDFEIFGPIELEGE